LSGGADASHLIRKGQVRVCIEVFIADVASAQNRDLIVYGNGR